MTPVQFGFCMPPRPANIAGRTTFLQDLNRALELITGHFDSAWFIDHLQDGDRDMLEGFTALTYMSALHPGLTFGHTVLCQSFRNPALVAKMGATLQFLSGGRFILGIGAGWNEDEYKAYGYDFPPGRVRVEQLEEAILIIKALWTERIANFSGKHYSVVNASLEPKPDPLPRLMVGAFGPKTLSLTAKYADWWDVSSTSITAYRRMAGELKRACEKIGRDPTTIRRSWSGGCACAPTEDEAPAFTANWSNSDADEDEFDFVGTPDRIIAQMRPFIEEGVSYFILDCGGFPNLTTLELLVSEVLPALKD